MNSLKSEAFLGERRGIEDPCAFDLFEKYKKWSDSRNVGELYMLDFQQMFNDLNKVEIENREILVSAQDKQIAENVLAAADRPPESPTSSVA